MKVGPCPKCGADRPRQEYGGDFCPACETYTEEWSRLGYRVEWSEREPRAYEVYRAGAVSTDNDCLARLPTVQAVAEWIRGRVDRWS